MGGNMELANVAVLVTPSLSPVCAVLVRRLSSYPGYLQMCHIQQSIITSITMTQIYRVSEETGILNPCFNKFTQMLHKLKCWDVSENMNGA